MPVVATIRPSEYFSTDEWADLSGVSRWRGLALVAHCWAVIGLALWASFASANPLANPLVWLAAIWVIGGRQLGLAILMHDAAHGLLHPNKAVNDFVGQWLCGAPIGVPLVAYRDYHLKHHRYTQQPEDPDLILSAPFPVSRASLRRKFIRDLTGQTFLKQFGTELLTAMGKNPTASQAEVKLARRTAFAQELTNLILFIGLWLVGAGWYYFLWFIARASVYLLVLRIRNIAEHACMSTGEDPFTHARTTKANWFERALVAPYFVNYHSEHHLFMYLPCYRLPAMHRALSAKNLTEKMTIAPNYRSVLRRVVAG